MPKKTPNQKPKKIKVPDNKILRVTLGALLIIAGILGFLPILGFWMLPLGLSILACDFIWAKKLKRKGTRLMIKFYKKYLKNLINKVKKQIANFK